MDKDKTIVQDSTARDALESYLSLPRRYRKRSLLEFTLRLVLDSGDEALSMLIFTDGRMTTDWLFPSGACSRRQLEMRIRSVAMAMDGTRLGRRVMLDGVTTLASMDLHPVDRASLEMLAGQLISLDRPYWSARLWRATGCPFCLYSTLDPEYVRLESERHGLVPDSSSILLLKGGKGCQELFFTRMFPHVSSEMTGWAVLERFLSAHVWAWEHVFRADLLPGVRKAMLEHLHSLPPSCRPDGYARYVRTNAGRLREELGEDSYLLGSPSDYSCMSVPDLERMTDSRLISTGAISYLPSRLGRSVRCRMGIVTRCSGQRARIICYDSGSKEVRRVLYEDMKRGDVVMLHRDCAIAVRAYARDAAVGEVASSLRALLSWDAEEDDGHLPSPVSDYTSQVVSAFRALCLKAGHGEPRFRDIGPGGAMSTAGIVSAMDIRSPQEYAADLFRRCLSSRLGGALGPSSL